MRFLFLVLGLLWCGSTENLSAQSKIDIIPIELHSNKRQFSKSEFVIIQLSPNVSPQSISNFNYLGDQWVALRLEDAQKQNLINSDKSLQYGVINPSSKLSAQFQLDFEVEKKWISKESIPVDVHFWSSEKELKDVLEELNITLFEWDRTGKFCTVIANQAQIESLSKNSFVSYIEPQVETRTPLLSVGRSLVNVNTVQLEIPKGLGIQGENIKIGVWDYGLTGFHRDIEGQFQNVENNFYNNGGTQHTTMVTGAIASKGILREESIGIAPKSKVYVYNFYGNIIDEILSAKNNYEVYVSNHSYNLGAAYKCFSNYSYNTASVQIDQFSLDEPELVTVFAAGNSAAACAYDYKTIVAGFQYGKNIITVGNLQNNETFYPGSAKGPTNDGRLKPDVMAKGSSSFVPTLGIVLPTPTDNYTYGYGTSFASPIVTAVVGLMQEAYLKKYGFMPSSATVKAILCNTAKDLGRKGPDYEYGFGKVDAYEAVKAVQDGNFIEDSIINNEEKNYTFQIPAGTTEAKFLITWNDAPASIPNTRVLVNDIDIELVGPDGEKVLPLVLNSFNPSRVAEEGRDSINNSEQIIVNFPAEGEYQLKVKGYNIISENQDFSISYWFNSKEFVWNYPLEKDVLNANSVQLLRWRTPISDSIQLQYSIDSGANWISIAQQFTDSNYYSWNTPEGHHSNVLLRALSMEDKVLSVSDTFIISPKISNVSVKICYDNIRLSWTKIPEADKYIVSLLNEKNQWNDIEESTSNIFYFDNAVDGKDYIFAVRPVIGSFEGWKSNAVKVLARRQGTCAFAIKDVGVSSIAPNAGTIQTEYALTDSEKIKIIVTNYSNTVANMVSLFYQVDTFPVREVIIGNMLKNDVYELASEESYDFSNVGDYKITAWIQYADDTRSQNDTLIQFVSQRESVIASFPYFQDFESASDTLFYNQSFSNIPDFPEWDYQKTETGRLYNIHDASFSPSGQKSLTVDSYLDNNASKNILYLNIDLENQKDSLVYLDYKLIQRNIKPGDSLFIKTAETDEWIFLKELYNSKVFNGDVTNYSKINLSKALFDQGKFFSNHNVLKFAFTNSRPTTSIATAGGYTIDDIRIYNGYVDLSLEKIEVPSVHCIYQNRLPIQIPIQVKIKNNSPLSIPSGEVNLLVTINDTMRLSEKISREIEPYETFIYELDEYVSFTSFNSNFISVELDYSKDSILSNNIIENKSLDFLKAIQELSIEKSFDDEAAEFFIPSGQNYTWEIGEPNKNYLYNVADNPGKAWVTDAKNFYNANENSYLYVGCFDPSLLNINSEMAFLMIYNTEFGTDNFWMEYSYNGENWLKFGFSLSGYNWYNKESGLDVWDGNRLNWQVASIPLDIFYGNSNSTIFFRYAFSSNEYIQLEGVAIDNFRINNNIIGRINAATTVATGISDGSGMVDLISNGVVYGFLDDQGESLGAVTLDIIVNDSVMPTYRDKFLLQRYYHIQTENQALKPYRLTLFNKNEEYLNYLAFDKNVRRMGEIGYLVYNGLNTDTLFGNNHFDENYIFYHPDSIEFWPYMNGYELRLSLDQKDAEIYLTSNLSSKDAYPFVAITDMKVYRTDTSNHTTIEWKAEKENDVVSYTVQHSDNGIDFQNIHTIDAHGANVPYQMIDSLHNYSGEHFYRIITKSTTDSVISLIDSIAYEYIGIGIVNHEKNNLFKVNYLQNGLLNIHWESPIESIQSLRIIDVSGRLLEKRNELLHNGSQQLYFNSLKNAASGMYFLQIIYNDESLSAKFVKSE
ncbi:MAG TPA: S8 family serine peptidase [Chitinophagales bacterium]|nr:S8 family serine peptidase [Chitinophagales bacterium]